MKEYQKAVKDLDHALALNPKDPSDYLQRGLAYLCLNNVKQARADFIHSWELNPKNVNHGWMAEWARMCQEKAHSEWAERLEIIASVDPQRYEACVCQGVALWLHGSFEKALGVFDRSIPLAREEWDAYFWKGMALASLKREEEAIAFIEKALKVGLPPVLLTPLQWLEQDKPDFYEKYLVPLFTRFNL